MRNTEVAAGEVSFAGPGIPLLRLEQVSKIYRMGLVDVAVLDAVSLQIHAGELLVIVGPSGSGKTTLLNLIGGVDRPTRGEVWCREKNLAQATEKELTEYRRESVGYVFQFYNLIPTLTALENVVVAAELRRESMSPLEALCLVGLSERADHFPAQLSGGEQQRVAIARALVKRPELLLCDEPTGALDYATGKAVLEVLLELHRQLAITVAIITHNAPIALIADRVIRLGSGRIVEDRVNPQPLAIQEITW